MVLTFTIFWRACGVESRHAHKALVGCQSGELVVCRKDGNGQKPPTTGTLDNSRSSARPARHSLCTSLCLAGAFTNMTPRKTECECGRPLTWRPNNRGGCDYCTRLEKEGYDQYIKPRSVTNRFGEPVTVLDAYVFRGQATGMINML